jgi:ADP-ribose pyrophosphatase YjhB (NUDIX family)
VMPRMLLLEIVEILVVVVGQHLVGLHQQENQKQQQCYVLPGGHQNKDREKFDNHGASP